MSGRVRIEELPLEQNEDGQTSRSLYIWDPPAPLKKRLPSWYQIGLECCTDAAGNRIFSPIPLTFDGSSLREKVMRSPADTTSYAWIASLGGRAILESNTDLNSPLLSWDTATLYQQYIRHRKEFLKGERSLRRSFEACGAERIGSTEVHALTGRLGLGPGDVGRPWTNSELREIGRQSARANGISNPKPKEIQCRALFEAARINPLRLNEMELESTARLSLFAIAPSEGPVTFDQLQYVARIVDESLREVCDSSVDETTRWIKDRQSNLLHRISKRRDLPMTKEQVKPVMLELGWKSFRMLADCVDAQMREIREAMPTPLNQWEADRYERAFLNNKSVCVPLVILHERLNFLKVAILHYWKHQDDPNAVAYIQTMMYYFSVLIEFERSEDRRLKQQRARKGHRAHVAKSYADANRAASSSIPANDALQEAALFVLRELGYLRGMDKADIEIHIQGSWDDDPLEFQVICAAHGLDETITISRQKFTETAKRLKSEFD